MIGIGGSARHWTEGRAQARRHYALGPMTAVPDRARAMRRGPRPVTRSAARARRARRRPALPDRDDQAAFFDAALPSKNCSSSVEPFSAAVDASRSIVVVTASK